MIPGGHMMGLCSPRYSCPVGRTSRHVQTCLMSSLQINPLRKDCNANPDIANPDDFFWGAPPEPQESCSQKVNRPGPGCSGVLIRGWHYPSYPLVIRHMETCPCIGWFTDWMYSRVVIFPSTSLDYQRIDVQKSVLTPYNCIMLYPMKSA